MYCKNRNDLKDDVLGAMINDLIEFGKGHSHEPFDMTKINDICQQLKRILSEQSLLLELFAPIKVVGRYFHTYEVYMAILRSSSSCLSFAGGPQKAAIYF